MLDRPVTGEDAAAQELVGGRVDGELEVAVEEPIADPLFEERHQLVE
jgi:hypothetical protein